MKNIELKKDILEEIKAEKENNDNTINKYQEKISKLETKLGNENSDIADEKTEKRLKRYKRELSRSKLDLSAENHKKGHIQERVNVVNNVMSFLEEAEEKAKKERKPLYVRVSVDSASILDAIKAISINSFRDIEINGKVYSFNRHYDLVTEDDIPSTVNLANILLHKVEAIKSICKQENIPYTDIIFNMEDPKMVSYVKYDFFAETLLKKAKEYVLSGEYLLSENQGDYDKVNDEMLKKAKSDTIYKTLSNINYDTIILDEVNTKNRGLFYTPIKDKSYEFNFNMDELYETLNKYNKEDIGIEIYKKHDYNDTFPFYDLDIPASYSKEKTDTSPYTDELTPYKIYDNQRNYESTPADIEIRFLNKDYYYPKNLVEEEQKVK